MTGRRWTTAGLRSSTTVPRLMHRVDPDGPVLVLQSIVMDSPEAFDRFIAAVEEIKAIYAPLYADQLALDMETP